MDSEEKFENTYGKIMQTIEDINTKLEKRNKGKLLKEKPITEKKNHQLHFLVEKSLMGSLKLEADNRNISLGENCRRKLRNENQLDRIEKKLDKILD
jgi:hypothetical protein